VGAGSYKVKNLTAEGGNQKGHASDVKIKFFDYFLTAGLHHNTGYFRATG
jgi:hypothetical protein